MNHNVFRVGGAVIFTGALIDTKSETSQEMIISLTRCSKCQFQTKVMGGIGAGPISLI